jgi:hypothetical protein
MILAEEKVEKNSLEVIRPELIGQAQQQQSIIRKIYKAVFASYRINCNCEVCKIMKEVGEEIEKMI